MSLMPFARFIARIIASNIYVHPVPYRITYAITDRCQAHCTMCNIWQKPLQNELSISEIDAFFTQANHFSWINLAGGELFQRPDIQDAILTIIKRSPHLYLLNFPTNGIQTTDIVSTVDLILQKTLLPRLIVSVSIDGTEDLHDTIRGVPGCWHQAINTFELLRERTSKRFSVYLGYTVQNENLGRFDETLAACQSRTPGVSVDDFHLNLAHTSKHYYDNLTTDAVPDSRQALIEIDRISSLRSDKLLDPVMFIERRYHKHTPLYLKSGRVNYICQAAAASCFITPSGFVYPCSVYDAPIGSLRDYDMNFTALWKSKNIKAIRKAIRQQQCPGCWTPCEAYQTLLANLIPRRN